MSTSAESKLFAKGNQLAAGPKTKEHMIRIVLGRRSGPRRVQAMMLLLKCPDSIPLKFNAEVIARKKRNGTWHA